MSNKENTSSSSSVDPQLHSEVERAIQDFDGASSGSETSSPSREWHGYHEAPGPGDGTLDEQTIESDMDRYDHYETASSTFVGVEALDDEFDERLQELNEERDRAADGLSTRQTQLDKKRIAQAFCSHLELTDYQQSGVIDAIETLDLNRFGSQGRIATVALGLIRYVVNKDRLERDLGATRISEEGRFQDLMDDEDVSMGDLRTVKRVAVEQLSYLGGGASIPRRDPNLPDTGPEAGSAEWWDRHFEAHYEDMSEGDWEEVSSEFIESIPERFADQIPDQYLPD